MATNPAHVVDRALLQLESGSVADLIGRILTKIEACKDEVKMTGQNSFRLKRKIPRRLVLDLLDAVLLDCNNTVVFSRLLSSVSN
eukprot:scaffold20461_cov80-Skeletonema_marinoi.AAC.2